MYSILNRTFIIGGCFVAAIIMGAFVPKKAVSRIVTNVPSDISGEEFKALVIEDFEKIKIGNDGWSIKSTPRQFTKAGTSEKLKLKNPVPTLEMKMIDGWPNAMVPEEWSLTDLGKEKKKCLGIHFKFRYPGYNSVSILPPPEVDWKEKTPVSVYNPSTNKNVRERAIQLPGRSRAISVWVHSRGRPYKMEVWIKDFRGNTHVLSFGSINFVGWRPMKVYIPPNIPQEATSYPVTRTTKITRFVIRSTPNAKPGDTYVFLDQLKVLTDTYEVNFDGKDLHKLFEKGGGGKGTK